MVRWKGLSYAQSSISIARAALLSIASNSTNIDEQLAKFYGLGGLEALADNTTSALNYVRRAISLSKKAIHWARHDIAWINLRSDPSFRSMTFKTITPFTKQSPALPQSSRESVSSELIH